jgi:hypothetical protein
MSTTAPVSDDRRTKPASGRSSNDAARVRRDPRGAATVAVGRQRSLKPPLMDSQQCNDMEPASRGRQQSRRCEVCISLDRQRRSKSSDSAMKTAATSASDALDGGNRTRQTTGTSHQRLTNRVDYIRSRSVGALPTRNRLTDDVIDVTSSTMSTAKDGSKVDSDFDQRLSTFRPKLTSQSTSDTNVSAEGQSCRRNTRNNLALLKMMAPDMEYGKRQPVGQQSQQTDQSTNFVRFSAAAVGDNDKQMQSTISCTGLKLIFTDALDQPQPVDVATDSLCDSLTFVPERHRREEGNTDRQMNDVDVAVRQSSCDDSLERVTSQVDDDVAVLRTAAVNSEYRKAMNLDDGSDDDIDNAMTIECFYSRRRLSVIREVSETDSAVM